MRLRHKRGSGGRRCWIYLESSSAPGGSPATGLASDPDAGTVHFIRDDMTAPERLTLGPRRLPVEKLEVGRLGSGREVGLVEVDRDRMPGLYELQLPPRLFAAGSDGGGRELIVAVQFPNATAAVVEVELVAYDPYDGVGIGLDGFTKAVRHQNLTSILTHIMPDSVRALVRKRRAR